MIHKIKALVMSLSLLFVFAAPLAIPSVALAAPVTGQITGGVCNGANNLDLSKTDTVTTCNSEDNSSTVQGLVSKILNIFSVIVGIIAVIMVVFAGFKYITSGGKDESVKTAKNTILYAVIGLVIVALAQVIVKFVLNKATQ